MKSSAQKSVNCPSCGAGLDILGGGRVRAHVCSYCGATLDAQEDYRILFAKRDMPRPDTPFALGMTGKVYGVDFTVIGTIQWVETYRGKKWTWVDHQIYSPTHGYAWLTWEDGHVVFSRKTRDVPSPRSVSKSMINSSESRPGVRMRGKRYTYYASGQPAPGFIEGEFNYVPDIADRPFYVELLGDDEMLSIIEGKTEREYELSTLPDRNELLSSFGIVPKTVTRPVGISPLDMFQRSSTVAFLRNALIAGGLASFVAAGTLLPMGERIAATNNRGIDTTLSLPFDVTNEQGLVEIAIYADVDNSWAWFESELLDAQGEAVAAYEGGMEYYHGYDGGERWSEGRRHLKTRVNLPAGRYRLEVTNTEKQIDWTGGRLASSMSVQVTQGRASTLWLWGTGIGLLLLGGLILGQRLLHNRRRWAGSDWSDD